MSLYCPICKESSKQFETFGYTPRENAQCPNCKSLERHRLSWLVIMKKLDFFETSNKKLLHFAPEKVFEAESDDDFNEFDDDYDIDDYDSLDFDENWN